MEATMIAVAFFGGAIALILILGFLRIVACAVKGIVELIWPSQSDLETRVSMITETGPLIFTEKGL
jgi:hypothetical protein